MVTRREGESDFAYHRRLITGKLIDKTLADVDYAELAGPVYGTNWSSDNTRKAMYGSLKTLELLEQASADAVVSTGDGLMDDIDAKMVELRKERQKMFDQRNALNKVIRERARAEEINDIIERTVASGNLPVLDYVEPQEYYAEPCDVLVSLNDIHYGFAMENYWRTYNSGVCKQMFALYIDKILRVASVHRPERCIVWANGDMISGNIHYAIAVANRENLVQQVMGVSELIADFIAELSKHFKRVEFVSVAGNHSRIGQKDESILGERLDDLVEWYLRARLSGFENVGFDLAEKIDTTMYCMNVRGRNYVGVHGDFEPTAQAVQTLQQMVDRKVYCVLSGHLHHNKTDMVQGIRTVMAGSFIGMDDYCIQKRLYGEPQQIIMIADSHGINCMYDVSFDK